jgi:GTPase Era involved in 16S rRNA processing
MTKQAANSNPSHDAESAPDPAQRVVLSLISHTNAGKTTLARTLLKRDIGEVSDEPHVTDVNEAYTMLRTENGQELLLWDTPGFGDPVRLLKRLRKSGNPVGWFLEQVWDRFRERPLWCSQQAIRNVRDDAEVVLYLINATELPEEAGYVKIEMQILSYLRKPVILILNQTGAAGLAGEEAARWRESLEDFDFIRDTLSLDAFTRCWVQEDRLLKSVESVLQYLEPAEPGKSTDQPGVHTPEMVEQKKKVMRELRRDWLRENLGVYRDSMAALGQELARAAYDMEPYGKDMSSFDSLLRPNARKEAKEKAMGIMGERLQESAEETLNTLLKLYGLKGQAARELLERLATDFENREPVDPGISAVLGGATGGAASGLAADFLAGGLTFGGGAVAGAILGALGAGSLAKGFNIVRGGDYAKVQWSVDFLGGLFPAAILRYLAVAHFGRGRGEWQGSSSNPETWNEVVETAVVKRQEQLKKLLSKRDHTTQERLSRHLEELFDETVRETLSTLHGTFPEE